MRVVVESHLPLAHDSPSLSRLWTFRSCVHIADPNLRPLFYSPLRDQTCIHIVIRILDTMLNRAFQSLAFPNPKPLDPQPLLQRHISLAFRLTKPDAVYSYRLQTTSTSLLCHLKAKLKHDFTSIDVIGHFSDLGSSQ